MDEDGWSNLALASEESARAPEGACARAAFMLADGVIAGPVQSPSPPPPFNGPIAEGEGIRILLNNTEPLHLHHFFLFLISFC